MSELTPEQVAAYEQKLSAMADAFGRAMSEELNRTVRVDTPDVSLVLAAELITDPPQVLQTAFSYDTLGPDDGLLVFEASDAPLLAHVAEGDASARPTDKVDDAQLNRLADVMKGLVQSFGTVIGGALGKPTHAGPIASALDQFTLPPAFAVDGLAIDAHFGYHIADMLDSAFRLIVTRDMALQLAGAGAGSEESAAANPAGAFRLVEAPDATEATPSPFRPIETYAAGHDGLPRGVDLILDIPLELTVELGRVRMLIKDVLELTAGSVVELDRLAGEPVDLLVNGRLVAKGEVVVIDDNFGVRVTEIVNQSDRVASLGRR